MEKQGKHVKETYTVTSPSLRTKIGAAAVSGCLVLAMAPGIALAVPSDENGTEAGNRPEMGMRMEQNGDRASMEQTFNTNQAAPSENGGFAGPQGGMQMPQGAQAGPSMMQEQNAPAPNSDMTGQNGQMEMEQPPARPSDANAQNGNAAQAPEANTSQAPATAPTQNQTQGSTDTKAPEGALPQNLPAERPATDGNAENKPTAPNGTANAQDGNTAPAQREGDKGLAQFQEQDKKIIDAIDNEDVKAQALAGNQDKDNKRPAIPEGQVNVRQLIDSIRNTVFGDKLAPLGENGAGKPGTSDAEMPSEADKPELPSIDKDSLPALPGNNGEGPAAPSGDKAAEATVGDTTQAGDEANVNAKSKAPAQTDKAANALAAPSGDDTSSLPLFQQIFEKVVEFFKNLVK